MSRPESATRPLQQHATVPLAEAVGVGRTQVIAAAANLDPEADLVISTAATGVALQLPALAQAIMGKRYLVKQQGDGAVTVTALSGETIDGGATAATTGAYTQVEFVAAQYGATREWLIV